MYDDYYVYEYPDDQTINNVILKSISSGDINRGRKTLKKDKEDVIFDATPRERKIGVDLLNLAEAAFTANEKKLFGNENHFVDPKDECNDLPKLLNPGNC